MLSFASARGNLFNRLGKLGLLIKQMRSYQNSQLTNMTDTDVGVVGQLNTESDIQGLMGNSYVSLLNNVGIVGGQAQLIAQQVISRMIFRDNPLLAQTLQSIRTVDSIQDVIRQMKLAGATVLAMTITAAPDVFQTNGGNFVGNGNGVLVFSVRRPSDGLVLENSFAEKILVTCVADSFASGTSVGNEGLICTGTGQEPSPFDFNWPLGSDGQITFQAVNGSASNSEGNILTNSGFDTFTTTANVPDNWVLFLGTAGTTIAEEDSIVFEGAASLRMIGDGSTKTTITQEFNVSTGTLGILQPTTQYAFNLWGRRGGTAVSAGKLTIRLVDQNRVTINDNNGTPNSFDIDLTTWTTNYGAYNGVFRTPSIFPPESYGISIEQSTALSNGATIYLDAAALTEMNQIYTSGPFISCFSGNDPLVIGDYAYSTVTNSRGSGGTLDTWQTLLARLFYPDSLNNEFIFPSSSSPSISDNLIG